MLNRTPLPEAECSRTSPDGLGSEAQHTMTPLASPSGPRKRRRRRRSKWHSSNNIDSLRAPVFPDRRGAVDADEGITYNRTGASDGPFGWGLACLSSSSRQSGSLCSCGVCCQAEVAIFGAKELGLGLGEEGGGWRGGFCFASCCQDSVKHGGHFGG